MYMPILHIQIHLQRHVRVTAPGPASNTTHFVAFGITSCSLEIGPNLYPRADDAGLVLSRFILVRYAIPRSNWES